MNQNEYIPLPYEYYGDNVRWFIATVIDASPPLGFEGRVKIRIHGLHSHETYLLPQQDLPWAQCVLPTTEGGISGIGKSPKLQSNSLVFGMFMDGKHSQTPIILGSLPHIELPTLTQTKQDQEDIGDDSKPENLFSTLVNFIKPRDIGIDNSNDRKIITEKVRTQRLKTAVRFFLNLGYTEKQSITLTAGLFITSKLVTNTEGERKGIGGFTSSRFVDLVNFSPSFKNFDTQLEFVAYELRGKKANANILLLQSDNIEGKDNLAEIVTKYYLENTQSGFKDEVEGKAIEILESIGE